MDDKIKWYYKDGEVSKPYPTLFGYRRRTVLIFAGAALLCLIVLIVGLAVGLNHKKPYLHFLERNH